MNKTELPEIFLLEENPIIFVLEEHRLRAEGVLNKHITLL